MAGSATCVLTIAGTAKCWGKNANGELGQGDRMNRGDRPGQMGRNLPSIDVGAHRRIVELASSDHTCALLSDSSIVCWGAGPDFVLGHSTVPDVVTTDFAIGAAPGRMGGDLHGIDLGRGHKAHSVTTGLGFTCALLDDGGVKCWGADSDNELGSRSCVYFIPSGQRCVDRRRRGSFSTNPRTLGDSMPEVDLGKGHLVTEIVSGESFTCALRNDNRVLCWGFNGLGQLGIRRRIKRSARDPHRGEMFEPVPLGRGRVAHIYAGSSHACALFTDGSFKCWGNDLEGQLGGGGTVNDCLDPETDGADDSRCRASPGQSVHLGKGRKASALALGTSHTCALLDDRTVKCWGGNRRGQLGIGHGADDSCETSPGDRPTPCRRTPPSEVVATRQGHAVESLAAGTFHNCVLYDDGAIQCWGGNANGELGYGDAKDRDSLGSEIVEY